MADALRCRAAQYRWGSRTSFLWSHRGQIVDSEWHWSSVHSFGDSHHKGHFEHLSSSDWMLNHRTFGSEFNAFWAAIWDHCKQNKGLRGRARDCESGHKHHTKNEGSENKKLQGVASISALRGLREPHQVCKDPQEHAGPVMSSVIIQTTAKDHEETDPQWDQGQPLQGGARGPVDTWAGPDFRTEI